MNHSLKSLEQHNGEARREIEHVRRNECPQPNGIACPECGAELMDSNAYLLTSYPPMRNVHCDACGYRGYRLA